MPKPGYFGMLILAAILPGIAGCAGHYPAVDPARDNVAMPEDPALALFRADIGMYVHARFRNGEAVSGYLVEKDGASFTLRGIGWQASRLTRYDSAALTAFRAVVRTPRSDVVY